METKPALKSKTLWANLLMAALYLFAPGIAEKVTPDIMVGIFTVVNILLRFVSKDKISLT